MSTDFTTPTARFEPAKAEIDAWNKDLNALTSADDLDSVMKALASIVDEYETRHMDHLQCIIYHKALDWLQSLKLRLEAAGAIHMIEYTTGFATSDGEPVLGITGSRMAMLYNTNAVSDEDARDEILADGTQDYDSRVVVTSRAKAALLFPHLFSNEDPT